MLLVVVAACQAGPGSGESPVTGLPKLEVLATSVQPPVNGLPVVAFLVRGPDMAGDLRLDISSGVSAAPDTTLGSTSCGSGALEARPLVGADSGQAYPTFIKYGNLYSEGTRTGWITLMLDPPVTLTGRCVLTFTLRTAWMEPRPSPAGLIDTPDFEDLASAQVRADGSALTGSPFPTSLATPVATAVATGP